MKRINEVIHAARGAAKAVVAAAAIGIAASASAATLDLSTVTANTTIANGTTLTGTLGSNVKLTIANYATVTLSGVTINGVDSYNCEWAGLTCEGNATIILQGNNTVKGFNSFYPGIYVPVGSTLTIKGTGALNASNNGWAAGIGGGYKISCGNIVIEGGTITATGGRDAAGIGSGRNAYVGNIAISGGTITATSLDSDDADGAVGIGGGSFGGVCNILISGGSVVATGGTDSAGIGGSYNAQCGGILISDGTIEANGGEDGPGIGSGDQGGAGCSAFCGFIVISGGDVTATAGAGGAAGIGSSRHGSCGRIYIESGITCVIANAGDGGGTPIGAGSSGTCGPVVLDDFLNDTTSGLTRTITSRVVNLANITEATTVADGKIITGTLGENVKVSIADGATVTLRDATINGVNDHNCEWAGLTCLGDATIILEGNNKVRGFDAKYPGIFVPRGSTLTIKGDGSLDASGSVDEAGYRSAAGIGAGYCEMHCGNIRIEGGTITAVGGYAAASIGGAYYSECGDITITEGVTHVTAIQGSDDQFTSSTYNIGGGGEGTWFGTVTIGGVVGAIMESPYTYIPNLDLTSVTADTTLTGGTTVTGTLGENVKVSIADGATVTLRDVTINGVDDSNYAWAGITCLGDATIILEGSNAVRGFMLGHPGIYVPVGKTLVIKGDGSLVARNNGDAAGIGSGHRNYYPNGCGNIEIQGGTITATGNYFSAGIGCGDFSPCGNITITGGSVVATGGAYAAGVGGGQETACGTITITKGVTSVTVTKGNYAPYSIGRGPDGTCGTVTIGGVVGEITENPYTYVPTRVDLSALSGDYTAADGDVLYGETDYAVTVPDGATVTVNGVEVTGAGRNVVTFNANGGTIGNPAYTCVVVERGKPTMQAGASATKTTRTGYTLVGWFDTSASSGGNMVFDANGYAADGKYWSGSYSPGKSAAAWKYAGSVTACARWVNPNEHTVTLNANGGTVSGAATVSFKVEKGKYTSQAGANRTISRTGYTLVGWFDTSASSGGNMVFNAQGYAVNGTYWNGSYVPSKSAATWKYDGNVTAYARWAQNSSTVTLDANGGTVSGSGAATVSFPVEYGKYTSQAGANRTVSRSGYALVGWFDTSAASGGNMVFNARGYAVNGTYWNGAYSPSVSSATWKGTGNVTAYARWVKTPPYRVVTFDANGGAIGNAAYNAVVVEDGKYTMQAGASGAKAMRSGYTLAGWYDAKTGGNMVFNAQGYAVNGTYWNGSYVPSKSSATWKYAGNVTAYARWVSASGNIRVAPSGNMDGDFGSGDMVEAEAPLFFQGEYEGVFADDGGRFMLTLDEGLETAYFVTWTDDGGVACECEAAVAGDVLILTTETGEVYHLVWDDGGLVATRIEY